MMSRRKNAWLLGLTALCLISSCNNLLAQGIVPGNNTTPAIPHSAETVPAWFALLLLAGLVVGAIGYFRQIGSGLAKLKAVNDQLLKPDTRKLLLILISCLTIATPLISLACAAAAGLATAWLPEFAGLPETARTILAVMFVGAPLAGILLAVIVGKPTEIKICFAKTLIWIAIGSAFYWAPNVYMRTKHSQDALEAWSGAQTSVIAYSQIIEKNPKDSNAYRVRAAAFQSLGETTKALSDYNKAIELNPNSGTAYSGRATLYDQLGKPDLSKHDKQMAAEFDPKTWKERGDDYSQSKQFEKASECFSKAIEFNCEKDRSAYESRGNAYFNMGQYQKAVADYDTAIELYPPWAELYVARGEACEHLGQLQNAVDNYAIATRLNSDDAKAYKLQATAYSKMRKLVENDRAKSEELDPSIHYKLGADYARKEQPIKAGKEFDRAIELDPKAVPGYGKDRFAKEFNQIVEEFSKAIEANPKIASGYVSRARLYSYLSENAKALNDSDKAIELDPKLALGYVLRGTANENLGQHQQALADYSKAIELNPKCAEAYSGRALAHARLKQVQEGIDDYTKAIELDPNDPDNYSNRGIGYHKLNQFQKSIDDASKAISLDSKRSDYYNNRAAVHFAAGHNQETIDDATKAIQLTPTFVLPYYNRWRAYSALGMKELCERDQQTNSDLAARGYTASSW